MSVGPQLHDPDADGVVGSVLDYPCDILPGPKYMWCDGATISRTQYALLFSRMGTRHGAGDGSSTFALPNRIGRFTVGIDPSDTDYDFVGEKGGSKTGAVTVSGTATINSGVTGGESVAGTVVQAGTGVTVASTPHVHGPASLAGTVAATGSAATVPPYDTTRYIVKVL